MKQENKIKVITGILFVILIAVVSVGMIKDKKLSESLAKEASESNEQAKKMNKSLPNIVCYGDGLTEGVEEVKITYPDALEDLIKLDVHNMGVSGEDTIATASRQGARQIMVDNITIPKDTKKVELGGYYDLLDNEEEAVRINNAKGINDCVIAGVKGELILSKPDELTNDNLVYYFKRHEAGEEVKITEPTPIITDASIAYKDDIAIIFMGENGGWEYPYDLVNQYNEMIEYMGHDKYIILGLTTGSYYERNELEQIMKAEFGDKYINLREYISSDGLKDADIKETEEDTKYVDEGRVPPSLLVNDINGNDEFNKLVAKKVFDKIIELEYLNKEQIDYLKINK